MKNFSRKRFFALFLSVVLCIAFNSTAFAAEISNVDNQLVDTTDYSNTDATPWSVGTLIDSGTNTISGYGTVTLHLSKSYYKPFFRAMAAGNSNVGVDCTVTLPNGETEWLGFVIANGEKTSYFSCSGTLPAGDYVFTFQCTDNSPIAVAAFIYANY